jgi:FkbM family methyltransferase
LKILEASGFPKGPAFMAGYVFFLKHFSLYWWRLTERNETTTLVESIEPGMTVVDVGANVGYYTILMSKKVGDSGKVFAFEPEPLNFKILEYHAKRYRCTNLVLEQKAVLSQSGSGRLYQSQSNPGDHRIYDLRDGRRSIPAEIVSLDDYFEDIENPIDFIKIDVQGAEMAVIDGMSDLLSHPSKTKNLQTLIEFCPLALQEFGSDPREFLTTLDSWGLKIRLLDGKKKNTGPIRPESLTWDHWTPETYVNLFCSRKTV